MGAGTPQRATACVGPDLASEGQAAASLGALGADG